ncbi:MAG: ABC transporter substrate-binding protein [Spirochaetia bacterium]|jgi:trehalose/maltose transport system substrate-binding protein|nr:ABC transporter substrate-binding protein [Spirochaetia bacterium]
MNRVVKVVIGTLLVGCASIGIFANGSSEEAASGSQTQEQGKIKLVVAAGAVGQELQLAKDGAAEYMKTHPDIEVECLETPDLTTDRLGLYLQYFEAKSSAVDLYQIDVIWPGDIAEHLLDLNQYGGADYAKDHFPAIVKNNTVDGKLVAMPWFTDAGLLYYRTDLLKKYGYDAPPSTWKELDEMAKKVQAGERAAGNQDFWGFVWQGNSYEGLTCDALEWINSNGGGSIVESNGKISIDNDKAAEAIAMAAGWVGTISPEGVLGFGEEDARNMFQAGNALFMRNWPYAYALGNSDDSVIKGKFDVAPLPAGASGHGAAALGGWQLACSKYSKHPKEATDLLFYLTGYEQQKRRAIVGSYNPTIKALYQDKDVLKATPFFGSLYDVFTQAVARPSTVTAPRYAEVSKVFFTEVHDVLSKKVSAEKAVKNISLDIADVIGK